MPELNDAKRLRSMNWSHMKKNRKSIHPIWNHRAAIYNVASRNSKSVYKPYIRRPRPEPWPGRRLGPPLVWTSSAAKRRTVASQCFLFLATLKASNASYPSKTAKPALRASENWKLWQAKWSLFWCQTQRLWQAKALVKRFKPFETCQTGS